MTNNFLKFFDDKNSSTSNEKYFELYNYLIILSKNPEDDLDVQQKITNLLKKVKEILGQQLYAKNHSICSIFSMFVVREQEILDFINDKTDKEQIRLNDIKKILTNFETTETEKLDETWYCFDSENYELKKVDDNVYSNIVEKLFNALKDEGIESSDNKLKDLLNTQIKIDLISNSCIQGWLLNFSYDNVLISLFEGQNMEIPKNKIKSINGEKFIF